MALSLSIHPVDNVLNMYGDLDPSSAYSLSGHVSISLSSSYSFFDSTRRTARLLLQSLTLTFEGQSEIDTPTTGYSSLRLCAVTRELAPSVPIELSNEGHEDASQPAVWNVIFNLPIPGWLPSTATLGIEDFGIRYTLYATAKLANFEEEQTSLWGFAAFCAPFSSRVKTVEANEGITIKRFIAPPKTEISEPCNFNFLVNATATSSEASDMKIPKNVLSKIQVLASVPEYVNMNDSILSMTLRLRTKDLCEEECQKLQVTNVVVDILQVETCRLRPSTSYLTRYPIPSRINQPPNLPLIDAHPVSSIYESGFFVPAALSESISRTFSLLPAESSGCYSLDPDNYVFAGDVRKDTPPTWYTMDTTIPFVKHNTFIHGPEDADSCEWAGQRDLRPTSQSPLYSVSHEAKVTLTCTYDLNGKGGSVATERLSFRLPLTFAHVAPRLKVEMAVCRDSLNVAHDQTTATSSNLPPYSELFDLNGERKIDSTPLPLYTPRTETTPSNSSNSSCPVIDITTNVNIYHDERSRKSPNSILLQDVNLQVDSKAPDPI